MFEFVLMVVLANAIMLACLYILRHVIAIRAPVLFIAVGISIFYCILYPFLVSQVPYPRVLYLYALLIMIGAALLYIIETRFFTVEEIGDNEVAGMPVGDALAVVEGKRFSLDSIRGMVDRLSLKERIRAFPLIIKMGRVRFGEKMTAHPMGDLTTGKLEMDGMGFYAKEPVEQFNRDGISPDEAFETIFKEAGQSDKTTGDDVSGEASFDIKSEETSRLEQPGGDLTVNLYTSAGIEAELSLDNVHLQEERKKLEEEVDSLALCASQVVATHFPVEYCAKEIVEVQEELSVDKSLAEPGETESVGGIVQAGEAVATVKDGAQSFVEISEGVENTPQDAEEITEGTDDMLQGTEEITEGTEDIQQDPEAIAEGAEDTPQDAEEIVEGVEDISEDPEHISEDVTEQLALMNSQEESIPPVSLYMLDILEEVVLKESSDKPGISQDSMTILDVDEVTAAEEIITSSDRDYAQNDMVLQDHPGDLQEETENTEGDEEDHPAETSETEIYAQDVLGHIDFEVVSADEAVDEPEVEEQKAHDDRELAGESQINLMVARAFDSLASGDSAGAVEDFFRVLKMEPPPKLAVMLCIEISSIYLAGGHKRQALAVLEMLEVVWGHALDFGDAEEVKTKIKRLKGEI